MASAVHSNSIPFTEFSQLSNKLYNQENSQQRHPKTQRMKIPNPSVKNNVPSDLDLAFNFSSKDHKHAYNTTTLATNNPTNFDDELLNSLAEEEPRDTTCSSSSSAESFHSLNQQSVTSHNNESSNINPKRPLVHSKSQYLPETSNFLPLPQLELEQQLPLLHRHLSDAGFSEQDEEQLVPLFRSLQIHLAICYNYGLTEYIWPSEITDAISTILCLTQSFNFVRPTSKADFNRRRAKSVFCNDATSLPSLSSSSDSYFMKVSKSRRRDYLIQYLQRVTDQVQNLSHTNFKCAGSIELYMSWWRTAWQCDEERCDNYDSLRKDMELYDGLSTSQTSMTSKESKRKSQTSKVHQRNPSLTRRISTQVNCSFAWNSILNLKFDHEDNALDEELDNDLLDEDYDAFEEPNSGAQKLSEEDFKYQFSPSLMFYSMMQQGSKGLEFLYSSSL